MVYYDMVRIIIIIIIIIVLLLIIIIILIIILIIIIIIIPFRHRAETCREPSANRKSPLSE